MDKHPQPETASEFPIEIRNAALQPTHLTTKDRNVTGAQIGHFGGAHPIDDFAVLAHLSSGATQPVRPEQVIDLADPVIERFFVIRADDLYRFVYADLVMLWPVARVTGEQLRFICKAEDGEDLMLARQDVPDEEIGDDDEVDLAEPGVERLYSRPAKPHITILVDAEPFVPPARKMTPNQIIADAAHKLPSENYLIRIKKHGNISYQDKGDVPIHLKDGMEFQVVSTGPTPVSDSSNKIGVAAFIDGLVELGFNPTQVATNLEHIYFDYVVPTGKFAGKHVRIGLAVPTDFPMTPPPGPNVSPPIHPNGVQNTGHPLSNISDSSTSPFGQAGGQWQYWSRPHQYWGKTKKTVAAYMNHLWQLWDSQ